jgi:hypothetical protein
MAKQINEPASHPQPSTFEIRKARVALSERQRALQDEGAEIYSSTKGSSPHSQPYSDHERRVSAHIQHLMNGSTPQQVLVPAVPRDEQIRAELDAIAFVNRELGRQQEAALEREAEQWVREHETQWRALCREIVLAAVRLATLEERARKVLEQMPPYPVRSLAMSSSIGSGLSLLGMEDPLLDLRTAALNEGVVTRREIEKATNG